MREIPANAAPNARVVKVKRASSKGRVISEEHSYSESIEVSSAAADHSTSAVGSMHNEVHSLRSETLRLGNDLNESNKERYNQIKDLMEALRIALEKNDKLEASYKAQLQKLAQALKNVSEEKGELESEILELLKRNGELGDLIVELRNRLTIKPEDDSLLDDLEDANKGLERRIAMLEKQLQDREDLIKKLKKPRTDPKVVAELQEKVVLVEGQLAYANKVNHEAVLAANVKVDHYEDCYVIGYDEEPDTIIGNSKRAVLELHLVKTNIKCEDRDCVKFTLTHHVNVKEKNRKNFTFGVHLFGPKEEVFKFKLEPEGHQYHFAMGEDLPCGKYRVSLTNKWINPEHEKFSTFLIKHNQNEYIKFDCQKNAPVISNTQCFEFCEDQIQVRQSEGVLRIPVRRDQKEGRLTYSWKTENKYKTGFHNEVGIQGFQDEKFDSTITMYLDSEHKRERTTEFWINLEIQQPDISCLCGRNKIKVTVINDIELTVIGLEESGNVGRFNCEDNPTRTFIVNRNTTKGYCDVYWETAFNRHVATSELRNFCECLQAPCVDLNFRLDKYYWNQQSGSVRFKEGEKTAAIELKIPCKSDLCFPEESVELVLREPRSKGVELDKSRAKCSFMVQFKKHMKD